MTLTTEVRINHPVNPIRLLDQVTVTAGGDPATVRRRVEHDHALNAAAQGLRTLAMVKWSECVDEGYDDEAPAPPAVVILSIDNPYGRFDGRSGREIQAFEILPAVAAWLDDEGVPRESWWWEDETAGTYHPGTFDVRHLADDEPRPTWEPAASPSR